jgi:Leucine-rich repeat (LRR) protein
MNDQSSLIDLDLSFSCDQEALSVALKQAKTIRSLDLTCSNLSSLPESIAGAEKLEVLKLGMNPLSEKSLDLLSTLKSLRVLTLNKTELKLLPRSLDHLPALEVLDLCDNQLQDWPFVERAFPASLKVLRLYGNPIDSMPEQVSPGVMLEGLSLGSVDRTLSSLPELFAQAFPQLRTLRLWGRLEVLPESFAKLQALEDLDLRANLLDDRIWPIISKLKALRELHIQETRVTVIPDSIKELTRLKVLEVQKASLENLSGDLWTMPCLEVLDLSDNAITSFPAPGQGLSRLKKLWLPRNRLKALPDRLDVFPRLEEFDLEGNSLTALPSSALGLKALRDFSLTGNSFQKRQIPHVLALKEQMYKRDPFAQLHEPRACQRTLTPEKHDMNPLASAVIEAAQRLSARVVRSPQKVELWPTAAGPWALTEAMRSFIRELSWPDNSFFDLSAAKHNIWSVDFSKPRPIPDFECSFLHPYICIADYHGGNELLLLSLTDEEPGDPMLYHIDHEESAKSEAISLQLRLSEFLQKLQ